MRSLVKILLIVISFVRPPAGSKINNEKPQAPPVPSITYTINVNLFVTQLSIRGVGGATLFHSDLINSDLNTLFGNPIDSQLGANAARKRDASKETINIAVNGGAIPVSFVSRITSNIKNLTSESVVNAAGTSFTYDLPSLNITTLSQIEKVLLIKRIVTVATEII